MEMAINGAKNIAQFELPLLGTVTLTATVAVSWVVMLIISGLCIWLGSGLKVNKISRKQAVAEIAVTALIDFVHGNMGTEFDRYIPLVGTIFVTSVISNLISLIGFWSPTADLMTELGWALVVFVLITYHKIKSSGIGGYLKGFLDPIFVMAPINVMAELFTPISMACRHFGNILSGTVISALIYGALTAASSGLFSLVGSNWIAAVVIAAIGVVSFLFGQKSQKKFYRILGIILMILGGLSAVNLGLTSLGAIESVGNSFPWLTVGIPAITSLYFDWFGGCIQAFIFCTLTTIFIKQAAG